MSLVVDGDAIVLTGRCAAEDAETLLAALQDRPGLVVDVAGVQKLHTAVLQILLALRPPIRGVPSDPFLRELVCTHAISE